MVLNNPWGLLALLSLPLIVYLHFFRDRRQVRRIGGLHLWRFAHLRLPAGRHFQRLSRSFSLAAQLLAALLLSLLIAGIDLPRQATSRHYTIVLDDSASMQAGEGETAAERSRAILLQWAHPRDRFTIVAAGARPRLLVGPFAPHEELVAGLAAWVPEAPSVQTEPAINLASKFLTGSEKILLLTDDPRPVDPYKASLLVCAVGKPYDNAAIEYADRIRVAPGRDRILLTLRSYAREEMAVEVRADAGGQPLFSRKVNLAANTPLNLSLDTNDVTRPIHARITDDALLADNVIGLSPVMPKIVPVAIQGLEDSVEYVARAIRAVPDTNLVAPEKAALLFSELSADPALPASFPSILRTFVFLPADDTPNSLALVQGEQLLVSQANPLTRGLSLEGIQWPYQAGLKVSPLSTLISVGNEALLYQHEAGAGGVRHYRVNLARNRSNLFRNAAWPILVQNAIEECRLAMPGMARANYRAGEPVPLRLKRGASPAPPYQLWRDLYPLSLSEFEQVGGRGAGPAVRERLLNRTALFGRFSEAPEVLQDLSPGHYRLMDANKANLAAFSVNLLAPGESDLRGLRASHVNLKQLETAANGPVERNKMLFFILLLCILFLTAASWVFQDMSR